MSDITPGLDPSLANQPANVLAYLKAAAAVDANVRQNYPMLSWVLNIPELKPIIEQAAQQGWDQTRLQGALEGTQWWQKTGATQRQWDQLKATDPASAQNDLSTKTQTVSTLAGKAGLNLDAPTLATIAENAIQYGWDDSQVQANLLGYWHYASGQVPSGDAGYYAQAFRTQAHNYLVNLSDQTVQDYAMKVATGQLNEQDFTGYLDQLARAAHPELASYMDKGITPGQFYDPYKQTIAKTLELNPDTIDFTDPKYKAITSYADPTTGQIRPMTLSEADQWARGQDAYWSTQQGSSEVSKYASAILRQFGAVGNQATVG